MLLGLLLTATVDACPFCESSMPTLCERIEAADVACFARLVSLEKANDPAAEAFGVPSWTATFEVETLLVASEILKGQQRLMMTLIQRPDPATTYLLFGAKHGTIDWSQPIGMSPRGREYIQRAIGLPHDQDTRLSNFLTYLNDEETLLADDAYAEFARAPFDWVMKIKDKLNREQVMGWIVDEDAPPERLGLLFTLLSVCGIAEDARRLEPMIRNGSQTHDRGFDSLIACYLTLAGDDGLRNICQWMFPVDELQRRQIKSADAHAAIVALRFHGEQQHAFSKEQISAVFRHVLNNPELAGAVIPDLARWHDWQAVDRLARMFLEVDGRNGFVQTPIVQYLSVCPLPTAKKHLERFAEIAPDKLKRAQATALFPRPPANHKRF